MLTKTISPKKIDLKEMKVPADSQLLVEIETNNEFPTKEENQLLETSAGAGVGVAAGARMAAREARNQKLDTAFESMSENVMKNHKSPSAALDDLFSMMDDAHEANYQDFVHDLRDSAHGM